VQCHRVERVAPFAHRRLGDGRGERDLARAALQGRDVFVQRRVARAQPRHRAVADHIGGARDQRIDAAPPHRHGRHHRHAELAFQRLRVEHQPVALGEIDHVERDHHRQAERDQLQREAQVIVEIGGIDHHDQRVGQPLAALRPRHHVARHAFVGAGRFEAVGAGQVDQLDRAAVGKGQAPRMALDRDAGIIAHLLPRAGHRVEQGALAGIGIADQRYQRRGVHLSGERRDVDRVGNCAAQRHRHSSDTTGDRPAAQPRAVQHLDPDAFVEA